MKDTMVKTTIKLPSKIWTAIRHRAIDEGKDMQEIIAAALAMYLKTPLKEVRS